METVIFNYVLNVISKNECRGISREEIEEKFEIQYSDFLQMAKNRSFDYGLKATITKSCVFFREL
ncbi:hypothetical protein NG800_001055 [Epilithonimonas ginsengisoli]|uniref:Uncharacterized protein n=1 Tax=Epilithonimonas ginsengisoli TaxID=1245592 RepID=A0ABU4JCT3_9FLAO|nr:MULTISPECIES: hypothetical protein [Chryseobacterium group]MBV6878282.1 hypothetical protein [Epilithonimonas sp. FP105]MDW8547477.1 hypothetical protein [Epilithonimonas ginsengisoli]OAH68934.1 hypothetical protein AXA65_15980 [Chryseobacterium sp. FP211-J200]